jgi:serine/threonine-protein kinase
MTKSLGSRYVLHEALGRGAMGQVFAGSIRPAGEPVAIKILRPELVSDPEIVARFVRERTILTSVDDPHVVRVVDLVVEGDTLGIVMELVRGPDLRRHLLSRRTVPPAEALHLTGQLLRGMAAVHAVGVIHRDIKPENVLVDTADGQTRLKLTDFGVARLSYGGSLTRLSGVIGTPEYMAPELAEHNHGTPAADVYSAGIVLYEMLCGRTPFAGGHPLAVLRRHADQPPPPIPGVPPALWDLIAWMLAKDPASRPASAAEAYAALPPLETALASWPALAPWAGPEAEAPAWATPPAGQTVPPGPAGPVPQATILRHRDRGSVPVPDGTGGPVPPPAASTGLLGGLRASLVQAPPGRRRRVRVAGLAIALVAVLGLATTVAMAATHRSVAVRQTADGNRNSPMPRLSSASAPASVQPTATQTPTPTPTLTPTESLSTESASSPLPAVTSAAAQTSAAQAPPAGPGPSSQPSVVIETVPGPTATVVVTPPASAAFTSAEQQLIGMLNARVMDNCTARSQGEGGIVLAAINCSAVASGPTLRPLVEALSSGTAGTWFQNQASGVTNNNDCPDGEYNGTWSHNGVVEGQLVCKVESNGLLRMAWVIDGSIGVIAEGSDHAALHNWWRGNACLVPSACPA